MRNSIMFIGGLMFLHCNGQNRTVSLQSDFQQFTQSSSGNLNSTSSLPVFNRKEATVGSQFLYNYWAKGMVTNKQGVSFTEGLFNYDKINKNLYILKGDTTFLIAKYQIQTIRLYGNGDTNYVLEKIPSLKTDDLYIVVSPGTKYSLLKSVETKLVLADFHTNGIYTSGKMYDEFRDDFKYTIVFADGSAHPVALKKKALKTLLDTETARIDQFYKEHAADELDEAFYSKLMTFLNQ